MSWTSELINVYDILSERNEKDLLPISHKHLNVQIQITLKEDGSFDKAENVSAYEDSQTIVPDTGKAKTGINPVPFPLSESLKFLAGDLNLYKPDGDPDNGKNHTSYMDRLSEWVNSEYTHKGIKAVYSYLSKGTLTEDCINSGVLTVDSNTGKLLKNQSQLGKSIKYDSANVRFVVQYSDINAESKTWRDKTLQESFIQFNRRNYEQTGLCCITGAELPITQIHPANIAANKPNAKLIGTSTKEVHWKGRFANKNELPCIGYEVSQKIHNALKWLIKNRSVTVGYGTDYPLTLVIWDSVLNELPDITGAPQFEADEYSLTVNFNECLHKFIFGKTETVPKNCLVAIMAFQATCDGRVTVSLYSEIANSLFYKNVSDWHTAVRWNCYNYTMKRYDERSFSLKSIIRCAYGSETLSKDKKSVILELLSKKQKDMENDCMIRLVQCVAEGRKIPADIVYALFRRASAPLSFTEGYSHKKVLETACGMIKKYYIDHFNMEGEKLMAYDPENSDRSYLFGCLLAAADKIERSTFDKEKDKNRKTNAERYWSAFVSRPYSTWGIIEEKLKPYLSKLSAGSRVFYERCINEIMAKFTPEAFSDSRSLEPMYLLGYHHYTAELYTKKNKEDNNNESAE